MEINLVEMYCDNCDRHTKHRFMGNFKDGIRTIGRYICKDCGTEQDGDAIYENTMISNNK